MERPFPRNPTHVEKYERRRPHPICYCTVLANQLRRWLHTQGELKVKTHNLSNDSDNKEDNDSVHTVASEDPEGARIVKQAMKAAQQSKSAGKSKADSHHADLRTMMSQDSKKSGTSKSKS